MSDISLECHQRGVRKIYDELLDLSRQGSPLQGLVLDSEYLKLDYRDALKPDRNPKGTTVGKGDVQIQCEELWENGLNALDRLGEMAGWEEDPGQAKTANQKQAIEKYQKFRRLIEQNTRRPIPWVLEAPYYGVTQKERAEKLKPAKKIRNKVKEAVKKLNELLDKEKLDPIQRQKCLIACLYWFVLVPEDGQGEPLDDQGHPLLVPFLTRQGIDERTTNKIIVQFAKYLRQRGGGLGLIKIGQNRNKKSDAALEATAIDTILKRKGWCTEQSKVMYAVLRMAGIEVFFVEPSLSVEYKIAKAKPEEKEKLKRLTETPLLSHIASGVAAKIRDKNDREGVWVIDVTSRLLEADYVQENPGQWEARPYWILSLRHFLMADLANLGLDQTNRRRYKAAEQSFKTALDLGDDSTAFHAMGNYAHLLSLRAELLSCRLNDKREICQNLDKAIDKYSTEAVEINPYNPVFQFSRGFYLFQKQAFEEAVTHFLKAMDADPRYVLPYQKLAESMQKIRQKTPDSFSNFQSSFVNEMHQIVTGHPKLEETIKKGADRFGLGSLWEAMNQRSR